MVHPRHTSVPARRVRGCRLGALAVVVALFAGACSGDDDSTDAATASSTIPPDTTAAPATTTPATTTPATSIPQTTVASTTTPVSSTTALDPNASTTTPTTTVTDPEVRAVINGLIASWTAFNEIKLDPLNDDKLVPVAETHRGELLDRVVEIVENLRIEGRRSVPNPEAPTELVPLSDTVVIAGTTATIDYCWVNSNILVETGGNTDGSDRLVDDSVTAVIQRDTFEFIDDRWLATGSEAVDRFPEVLSCDAVV